MNVLDFIGSKRDGGEHDAASLKAFVQAVTSGSVPDYQVAAWLMAVCIRGMTHRETLDLTLAMRDSGRTVDLSGVGAGPRLDKHSTGGVGDKASLIVGPALAAAGARLLKMSGRGLGSSGGTIDKLESIPGFRTGLSLGRALHQVSTAGICILAQSADLAPADGILYALRDVTATVPSIPLIASSIMSKKLAGGSDAILLDVKVGSGAFMRGLEEGRRLAGELASIGAAAGVKTLALLTDMDAPLGRMVGNAMEVREALDVLEGRDADRRLLDLCVELTAHGLLVGRLEPEPDGARIRAHELIRNGAAAAKFAEMSAAQGGPATCAAIRAALPAGSPPLEAQARRGGFIKRIDAGAVGRIAVRIGAGRERKGDAIDPSAGIELLRVRSERVSAGETVALVYPGAGRGRLGAELLPELQAAFEIGGGALKLPPVVLGEAGALGEAGGPG